MRQKKDKPGYLINYQDQRKLSLFLMPVLFCHHTQFLEPNN
jgi:hypothetical protein